MCGAMRLASILIAGFLVVASVLPRPALAHPHEFVDASFTLRFDDAGRLDAIGVTWVWDDFTSMLILEDMGMDSSGDGTLTPDEKAQLVGLFSDWPEDFDGDLYVTQNGTPVALGGPLDMVVDYRDGQLIARYLRRLPEPVGMDDPLTLQAYDPAYYAFYDLAGPPQVQGREDCEIDIRRADIAAAQKLYDRLLGQLSEEEIMEKGMFPEVGGAFADEVLLQCGK